MGVTELIEQRQNFVCLITRELITDPVYIENNKKYYFERSGIMKWFESSDTNPWTNLPVKSKKLTDYPEMKQRITKYVKKLTECIAFESGIDKMDTKDLQELESILKESANNKFRAKYLNHAMESITKCLKKRTKDKAKDNADDIKANNDRLYQELVIGSRELFDEASARGENITGEDIEYARRVNRWSLRHYWIMIGSSAVAAAVGAAIGVSVASACKAGSTALIISGVATGVVGAILGCMLGYYFLVRG